MHKKSAVLTFIEEERGKGVGDKEIQHQLLDAGWQMDIIHRAMEAKPSASPKPPAIKSRKSLPANRFRLLIAATGIMLLILLALFI